MQYKICIFGKCDKIIEYGDFIIYILVILVDMVEVWGQFYVVYEYGLLDFEQMSYCYQVYEMNLFWDD